MAKATLSKNGIATQAGDIAVYNFDATTREYRSSAVEYLSVGVGLPAHSCAEAPCDKKEGFAVCRTLALDEWGYVIDHRGETVYDIRSGQSVDITEPGDYAVTVTPMAPSTPYDQWSGSEWVTDIDALKSGQIQDAEQKKERLLAEATNTISLWQTALQLGIISNDDKKRLMAWMSYIQSLQALDTDHAPDIDWPPVPD